MLQRVVGFAASGKRHFALNLIATHWREIGRTPRGVPRVKDVRHAIFCCHCDADTHRCTIATVEMAVLCF